MLPETLCGTVCRSAESDRLKQKLISRRGSREGVVVEVCLCNS